MPTYEYACQSCGRHVEVYQRFSDDPLTECGLCGGPLRKVFHPAGILFKGSGFYATDSRSVRSGSSTDSKRESASESKAAASETSQESKAESRSGSKGHSGDTGPSTPPGSSKEKSA
jgi:putative FmdB family regulatory protein